MILAIVFIVLGVFLLAKGADWMVDGAASLAKRLGVAPIVIGLTVVSFGTSAPELVVNLVAATSGNTDIAIGNIIGSNIANILLILGIAAVITPLTIKKNTVWKEIPLALLAVVLVGVMAADRVLTGRAIDSIDRIDALSLLAFFVVFLYYTFGISKTEGGAGPDVKGMSVVKAVSLVSGGLLALVAGGKLTVDGAISIAQAFGVAERIIGLTVVAIGTSLPELVTSAIAAKKGQVDIAIGNVVGSNIFNIFLVLGISAFVAPLPLGPDSAGDILVAIGAALMLFMAMFVGRRHQLERWQGAAFIGCYAVYVLSLILLA